MEARIYAGIAALVLAALAVTAAAIDMAGRDAPEPWGADARSEIETPEFDPLRDELRRCQEIGGQAAEDPVCLAAWAEARRRFLGQSPDRKGLR